MRFGRRVTIPPLTPEGILAAPLPPGESPRRLVVVRLHAFGDTVAVLPVLAGLAARFPGCRLEVVTGPASGALFRAREEVSAVHILDTRAGRLARILAVRRLARILRSEPLDAVLDLQRSPLSRALLRHLRPRAFCQFDRFAPRHGLERYVEAVEACGLGPLTPLFVARTREAVAVRGDALLRGAGRDPGRPLVLLNPAGGWETKQWPLDRWAALGRALSATRGAQLLLLGAGAPADRVASLAAALGGDAIDLTGRTDPGEALAVAARCALAVSEDSGLMHLAWVQGIPVVALFGATRATWSRPLGAVSSGFYSEDLPCGACMQPVCARGDLHCLIRLSVDDVLARADAALTKAQAPDPAR